LPAPAATAPAAPEDSVPVFEADWPGAGLDQVLKIYSDLVGRTVLRPANLAAPQIVLKTHSKLTREEAIQALDAVLALNGIAMLNVGDKFVKAVPVAQANQEAKEIDTRPASELPDFGSYVTHVVQVKNLKPSEIQPVLQQFAKVPNSIFPIDANGILVLRDYTENVKRMLEMIEKLDVSVPSEFVSEVIPIKYALASDIASALSSLGGGGGSTSVGQRQSRGTTGGAGMGRPGTTGFGAQPGINNPMGQPGQPAAGTPSSGASFSDRLQQIIKRASSAQGDLQILGTTKIIADERMNALLVFASRQDMDTITNIVAKLDVVLAQVLIETVIMDVSLGDTFNLGVSAGQSPKTFGSTFTGGGVVNNGSSGLGTGGSFLNGLISQIVSNASTGALTTNLVPGYPNSDGLSYFGKLGKGTTFDVAVSALATDNRVNVIQKPRIQTSHATPASIFIGSTVPYVTGTYYGGYGGNAGNSYQQLKVGIGLNVTPFINPEGLVVMKIDEQIDELAGSTAITGVGNVPNTTSRSLSAEVAVRDRETIILGGFIRNSDSLDKTGVPYLQDIPLLGYLFRSTGKVKERKELIVLMRPTVLRTPELAAAHVSVEKERLPGVRRAEIDLDEYERAAAKGMKKEGFDKPTPFTSEEIKLYGTPPSSGTK
jgi:general secretion pathway protein D